MKNLTTENKACKNKYFTVSQFKWLAFVEMVFGYPNKSQPEIMLSLQCAKLLLEMEFLFDIFFVIINSTEKQSLANERKNHSHSSVTTFLFKK